MLPASTGAQPTLPRRAQAAPERSGAILVMDDDESVRRTTRQMLECLGYETIVTSDGVEAIESYRQRRQEGRPFAAIIMDLTVRGGMGGIEAIRMLRQIDPEVRAVVTSGYSAAPAMANIEAHGFCGVVAKPFTIGELDKALLDALSRRRPPTGNSSLVDASA